MKVFQNPKVSSHQRLLPWSILSLRAVPILAGPVLPNASMILVKRYLRSYNGDTSFSAGRPDTVDLSCPLVEGCQPGSQVSRVAAVGGHFGQPPRDLSQSLGPSRSGVGHHTHVQTHVPEVLRDGDTRVDRGLSCRYRHVGSIGYHDCTSHDTFCLARGRCHCQLKRNFYMSKISFVNRRT